MENKKETETQEIEILDCIAGKGERQGRIKKDSPDFDEFSEFQRDIVLAAKAAPKYSKIIVNNKTFILLGHHSSRGARGSSCLVIVPFIDEKVQKQRYFFDWSKNNGVLLQRIEFPLMKEYYKLASLIREANFGPIPNGTGSNSEWHAACQRGEFLTISRFFETEE
jgi:hypothetical protein